MDYLKFKELMHSDEIRHYGIPGQRWGVRRFQNENGSLTSFGLKKQLRNQEKQKLKGIKKELNKKNNTHLKSMIIPNDKSVFENEAHNRRIVNRAAKYVQKKKMSYDEALKKSNNVSLRNSVLAYIGVLGATAATSIIAAKTAGLV